MLPAKQSKAPDRPPLPPRSDHDTMTDPDGSRQLVERAASTDKQLHILKDMWHIITKEPGNEKILADVTAWIEQRL